MPGWQVVGLCPPYAPPATARSEVTSLTFLATSLTEQGQQEDQKGTNSENTSRRSQASCPPGVPLLHQRGPAAAITTGLLANLCWCPSQGLLQSRVQQTPEQAFCGPLVLSFALCSHGDVVSILNRTTTKPLVFTERGLSSAGPGSKCRARLCG